MTDSVKYHMPIKVFFFAALSLGLSFILEPMEASAGPNFLYNFSFISNIPTGGSIVGQFLVTYPGGNGGSFPYTAIEAMGNVYGFQVAGSNGAIFGLIGPDGFGGNDNWFSTSSPYVTMNGVSFNTTTPSGAAGASFRLSYTGATWAVQDAYNGFGEVYYGTMSVSQ